MIYLIKDFYIEADSKQDALLKYVNKRQGIYDAKEDIHCLNSRYTAGEGVDEFGHREKIYEISDESAEEFFGSLLEYAHKHCHKSYLVKPCQNYGYESVLILSEDKRDKYAAVVAVCNEGNGVYSVGPGLTGVNFLRVKRLSCCDNYKNFLREVNNEYQYFCEEYSRFKKHRLQF